MDLIIRGKKIKDNVRCTEGSSPIVPLFLQQSLIILLSLLSPIPCNPYKQEVREVVAAHYFMYKMPTATTLSTLLHGTNLLCLSTRQDKPVQ